MKRYLMLLLAALWLPVWLLAENYPYRSDLLWVARPDHADWLYKTGQKATVEIQLYRYGIPLDGIAVDYELADELMPADKSGRVVLKEGKATIPVGTMKRPGIRDCRLTATVDGKAHKYHVKVGFSPEQIEPCTALPADFREFWERNKAELAALPLRYTIERAEKYCTDRIECHLVKLQIDKQGRSIYGYLFRPVNARPGSCPAVFCPPGAGIKTIKEPLRRKYYAEQGCIRFEFEIHGLHPELPEERFREISAAFNGRENGYLTNGLDNRDNYYMKRVYLACVRAADFLTSLPEWDGRNLVAQGGSQGGALALVAGWLDPRITACVANHPALSDMARGFKLNEADGYPHFTKIPGTETPDKLRTMAYYDVVNFARMIRVPVRMTWGYNDDTCPATTSYAVYNVLSCPKEALLTPINEHWTSEQTERGHLEWILNKVKGER